MDKAILGPDLHHFFSNVRAYGYSRENRFNDSILLPKDICELWKFL